MSNNYPFGLQDLPFAYDALAPVINEDTLHFHHDKHMNAYVTNLNKALEPCTELHGKTLEDILAHLDDVPESARTAVRNNGGGVYNHQLYFSTLTSPDAGTAPSPSLAAAIERDFGGMEAMTAELKKAATGRFGSGWAYVVSDGDGRLSITSTPNQDVPDLNTLTPLMTVDVWEHAYYLDYQNRRPDYFDELMKVIDWNRVSENYDNR